jgi:hypothetical protein
MIIDGRNIGMGGPGDTADGGSPETLSAEDIPGFVNNSFFCGERACHGIFLNIFDNFKRMNKTLV